MKGIATVPFPWGTEHAERTEMNNISVDYYWSFGCAPLFDVEALEVNGFVDQFAVDGWWPGEICIEGIRTWAWRHQCSRRDEDLIRSRGVALSDVRRELCEKLMSGL